MMDYKGFTTDLVNEFPPDRFVVARLREPEGNPDLAGRAAIPFYSGGCPVDPDMPNEGRHGATMCPDCVDGSWTYDWAFNRKSWSMDRYAPTVANEVPES
jgi:hypothetical protein